MERVVAPELAKEGKTVKALDRRPYLDPHLQFYMDAFSVLDRGREVGMGGPRGISFPDIDAYASRYGIDSLSFFERFLRLIMAMDDAYLKRISEKAEVNT